MQGGIAGDKIMKQVSQRGKYRAEAGKVSRRLLHQFYEMAVHMFLKSIRLPRRRGDLSPTER
jgi:hypothetical protein